MSKQEAAFFYGDYTELMREFWQAELFAKVEATNVYEEKNTVE